jgi:PST family polysaccharide transporter
LAWSFVLNGGRQTLSSVFTLALAMLLGPEDFGTVTIALSYVMFLQIFVDNGLGEAIVQRRDLTQEHLTAAFWLLVGGSVVLLTIAMALTPWWVAANRLPSLGPVTTTLTLLLPIRVLSVVHQALLRRHMDFRSLAIRSNCAVLTAGLFGLWLAWRGFGMWALVAFQLTTQVTMLILYWTYTRWRPVGQFSARAAKDLLAFSIGSLLAGFGSFVNARCDAVVIGLFFGPSAVGAYRLAERIVTLVIESAARPVTAVALPHFARLQTSPADLTASILRCVRLSAILTLVPLAVLGAGAPLVIKSVGPKWVDAQGALVWLCAAGAGRSLVLFLGPLLSALGRPHALAALLWGTAVPSTVAVIAAALWVRDAPIATQAAGIGASRAVLFLAVFFPVSVVVARRLTGLTGRALVSALSPSLAAAALAAVAVVFLRVTWGEPADRAGALLILILVGAVAGAALLGFDRALRLELQRGWKAATSR